ncbi:hypothetical protein KYK29_10285 [Shinella daejeonensis]|uniref:hypothetical protein n=1 Tax=Shinella daejeonensis TaxID=659017 RepID=UPI0020C7DBEA|nr:hypothetical protein [Shinella daejeonensis]MCP8895321.1 hypothetical protein [Shinella daejeonensis]
MRNKSNVVEDKMNVAYVNDAKAMSEWLLRREYRGLGDTQEAAAGRAETKWGAPAAALLRLRHREITDMKLSTWASILEAFQRAGGRIDALYEEERSRHGESNSALVRLADFVAGERPKSISGMDAASIEEAEASDAGTP